MGELGEIWAKRNSYFIANSEKNIEKLQELSIEGMRTNSELFFLPVT